ncbi:hypothetical protein U1Q18_010157 [Sarracenia purpurea var. burkii]
MCTGLVRRILVFFGFLLIPVFKKASKPPELQGFLRWRRSSSGEDTELGIKFDFPLDSNEIWCGTVFGAIETKSSEEGSGEEEELQRSLSGEGDGTGSGHCSEIVVKKIRIFLSENSTVIPLDFRLRKKVVTLGSYPVWAALFGNNTQVVLSTEYSAISSGEISVQ